MMKDVVHRWLTNIQLFDSSWLKKVEAYEYDDIVFVIAEIKQDEIGLSTKQYIFCGVPNNNWDHFITLAITSTYGEKFHKYILDYVCNCS